MLTAPLYLFVAKVTVKPEVTLGEYKGPEGRARERQSDRCRCRDRAERHGRSQCLYGRSPEGAKAEMGDTAVIDYKKALSAMLAFEG